MNGRTISHYQVVEKIGEGGMGVVYKAEDTLLNRTVAIKFLHATDDMPRLLREARAAASLNHPNVCTVHEVDPEHSFLVMEFVEGESLARKIGGRPLPVREAVKLAAQICEGLKAAHLKGIVHRDIKSGNVLVTGGGQVKILDFGLAKTQGQATLTREGAVVGTLGYMSPEQMRCEAIDQRTDIWALGAVLHEMLTGRLPMGQSETLPEGFSRVVQKALAADPGERYQHVDELLVDLRALGKRVPQGIQAGAPGGVRFRKALRVAGIGAAGLAILLGGAEIARRARNTSGGASIPTMEFKKLTSTAGIEWFPSLSPDGEWFAYGGASASGRRHIYLQSVSGENRQDLTPDSTADDDQPAFSPKGERIAFHSTRGGGGIFVMGRTGEAVKRITSSGFNPAWSPDGALLAYGDGPIEIFPQNINLVSQLWIVEVESGKTWRLFEGDAVQPSWSPHNLRIAYTNRTGNQARGGIWTVPAAGGTPVPVTSDPARDWSPVWSPDGKYLYFASDRGGSMNLWRIAIDEKSGKARGRPQALTTPAPYLAHLSFSADGKRIAYSAVLVTSNVQQLSLDASFHPKGEPSWVTNGSRRWSSPDPSPDGEWVAFYSLTEPEGQIYIAHPDGSGLHQVTSGAIDRVPRWSPDGRWLAYASDRSKRFELWKIRPDGSDLQQLTSGGGGYAAWHPDGLTIAAKTMLFDPNRPWKEQTPETLPPLSKSGDEFIANSWSPDSRYLAGMVRGDRVAPGSLGAGITVYSLESRSYTQITDFGEWPVWLPDSRHLLFVANGNAFYVADVDVLSRQAQREAQRVYSVTGDVIGPPRVTRDGKKMFFSRRVTESDVWLCSLRQ